MEIPTIKAQTRPESGKGAARRARATGNIPAVLYGGTGEAVSIQLNTRDFEQMLQHHAGEQMVVQLQVEDNEALSHAAFLKVVQHHPLKGFVEHVDFIRIRLDEKITASVPLTLVGRPVGVAEEGGVLDHQLREIEVECLATEIPAELTIDISNLHMGEGVHVGDIPVSEGIEIVTDLDRAIAAIHAPRIVKSLEEEEAELAEAEAEAEAEEASEDEG